MKKKIFILGGGFAGIEAAIYLKKDGHDVTLISNRDYFYIYPISIWIPIGKSSFENTCVSLYDLQKVHKFNLIIDEVENIQSQNNKILCKNETYSYDYLIVAMGSGKIKHKGGEHFLSICGEPTQSVKLKEKIDTLIKKGSGKIAMGFGGNPADTSNVRGGPAFELLFNLHHMLVKKGIRDKFDLTFFAPMEKPGIKMGSSALEAMNKYFKELNINTQVGIKIAEFQKDGIVFANDFKIQTDLTMFIPAGTGHNAFINSDLPLGSSNLLEINDFCEVTSNVYAIGDSVAIKGPKWVAKQGHIAEVMARNVAYNLSNKIKGKSDKKGYSKHINILCIMDVGNGAIFIHRDLKGNKIIPMPVYGHWIKKGWGWYCKNSKLNKIPRIPGL